MIIFVAKIYGRIKYTKNKENKAKLTKNIKF